MGGKHPNPCTNCTQAEEDCMCWSVTSETCLQCNAKKIKCSLYDGPTTKRMRKETSIAGLGHGVAVAVGLSRVAVLATKGDRWMAELVRVNWRLGHIEGMLQTLVKVKEVEDVPESEGESEADGEGDEE